MSNNSRPLFLSRTCSLESRRGDLECLRLRSRLRSRGLSSSCGGRALDFTGLRSLALVFLSLSGRRDAGERDLLACATPRSTLPLSLRSSPWLQLSFIASTCRRGECCVKGIAKCKVKSRLLEFSSFRTSEHHNLTAQIESRRFLKNHNAIKTRVDDFDGKSEGRYQRQEDLPSR